MQGWVFVIGAVILIALAVENGERKHNASRLPSTTQTTTQSPEPFTVTLRRIAAETQKSLPQKFGDHITATNISVNGMTVTYDLRYDEHLSADPRDVLLAHFNKDRHAAFCDQMRGPLEAGVSYRFRLFDQNDRTGSFDISPDVCAANRTIARVGVPRDGGASVAAAPVPSSPLVAPAQPASGPSPGPVMSPPQHRTRAANPFMAPAEGIVQP